MQTSKTAPIEQLPVELRGLIFKSLADTPALYNLIRSSREYYQAYIGHEQSILYAVLCNEMGHEALDDAFTTIMISLVPHDNWLKEMENLLYEYEYRRKHPECLPEILKNISLWNLRDIGRTHRMVRDLTEDFYRSTLSQHPISGEELSRGTLSRNERRRIDRAFYHYQFFKTLLETKSRLVSNSDWDRHRGSKSDTKTMFHGAGFHCWERGAMTCVRDYLMGFYDRTFRSCRKELEQMLKRRKSRYGGANMYNDCLQLPKFYYRIMTRSLIAGGLGLTHKIMHESDPIKVFVLIDRQLFDSQDGTFDPSPSWSLDLEIALSQHLSCSAASHWHDSVVPNPFTSDDDRQSPNVAWTWAAKHVYRGSWFPSRKIDFTSWGFLMWDKDRLDELGVMQVRADKFHLHVPTARARQFLWED